MSTTDQFSHFFKAEVRNAGEELIAKKAVFMGRGSDTQVDASVRGTTPAKVSFWANSIADETFYVDCNCKTAAKGTLCKHIWATLVLATDATPDFFDSKTSLEKESRTSAANGANAATPGARESGAASAKPAFGQTRTSTFANGQVTAEPSQREIDFKQKQADYRKQAYQTQKPARKISKPAVQQKSSANRSSNRSSRKTCLMK